jgi:hypothetical protein
LSVLLLLDLNLAFCFISAGKRKDQAPAEPEPSKRLKGQLLYGGRKHRLCKRLGTSSASTEGCPKQAEAQALAHASHSEADAAAHAVDLPEGAPAAVLGSGCIITYCA